MGELKKVIMKRLTEELNKAARKKFEDVTVNHIPTGEKQFKTEEEYKKWLLNLRVDGGR